MTSVSHSRVLNFVKERPSLQQLSNRLPSNIITFLKFLDDGHYPKIKSYSEYNREDVHKLITMNKLDEVSKVIQSISLAS